MAKSKGQTFMFGAIILMISNIAVKVIGAFLRIPLTNIIGVEGMAYYNAAYSIYVSFYMISTAGIPVAVSRMIAVANSKNNHKEIKRIFDVAFALFFVIGFLGTAAMMIGAGQFSESAKMPDATFAMMAIAPTIFFICLSSAYRGYFQGLQNMVPTAVSQVIEAAAKLGIGIIAAIYFTSNGYPKHEVAAYVILGVTIGVLLGVVYGAVAKAMFNSSKEQKDALINCNESVRSKKSILKELVVIAIPITLASSIMGLTNLVDTMLFANGLQSTGLTEKVATSYYGAYTSMVYPLFNLVPPFIFTFGISAIPAISSAIAVGDRNKASKDIESAFRNCAIIAIPCAIGLGTLSKRVISFLFNNEVIGVGIDSLSSDAVSKALSDIAVKAGDSGLNSGLAQGPIANKLHFDSVASGGNVGVSTIDIASPALSLIVVGILFLGVISITNSVLQACKKEKYTIISTTSGIAVKAVSTFFLSRIPGLGLLGAAGGTLLCYFTIMCLNLFFMIKMTGFVPKASKILSKPLLAGIGCGVAALGMSFLCDYITLGSKLATVASIGVAAVVYIILLLILKGLNRYDVMMMPKGAKLCSILDRFNLLEKGDSNE